MSGSMTNAMNRKGFVTMGKTVAAAAILAAAGSSRSVSGALQQQHDNVVEAVRMNKDEFMNQLKEIHSNAPKKLQGLKQEEIDNVNENKVGRDMEQNYKKANKELKKEFGLAKSEEGKAVQQDEPEEEKQEKKQLPEKFRRPTAVEKKIWGKEGKVLTRITFRSNGTSERMYRDLTDEEKQRKAQEERLAKEDFDHAQSEEVSENAQKEKEENDAARKRYWTRKRTAAKFEFVLLCCLLIYGCAQFVPWILNRFWMDIRMETHGYGERVPGSSCGSGWMTVLTVVGVLIGFMISFLLWDDKYRSAREPFFIGTCAKCCYGERPTEED